MATARELIGDLLASGWTKAEIARKLGRNSSTLSQVEKGKKPGANLVAPLEALKNKATSIPKPEQRKTKGGEVAKVRKSTKPPAPRLKRDGDGRIKLAPPTEKEYVALRRLKDIADDGGKVSIRLVFAGGREKVLYERGGEYAQKLVYQFENSGLSFFDWLSEKWIESTEQRYGIDAEKIERSESPVAVGFLAIYTAAEARL